MPLRYLSYRVVSRLYFHLPVLVPFLVLGKVGAAATAIVAAAYGVAMALMAPRAVSVVQRLGSRRALQLAETVRVASIAVFAVTTDPVALVLAQFIGGAAASTAVSADLAVAREAFKTPDAFGAFQARAQGYMFGATLVSGICGAVLFQSDRRAPFIAATIVGVGAILLARRVVGGPGVEGAPVTPARPAVARTVPPLNAALVAAMAAYVVCRAAAMAAAVAIFPYYLVFDRGISVPTFGVVIASFSLAGFAMARSIGKLSDRVGASRAFVACIAATAAGLALPGVFSQLGAAIGAVILLGAAAGAVRPLALKQLASEVEAPDLVPSVAAIMERWFGWVTAALVASGLYAVQKMDAQPVWLVLAGAAALSGLALVARIHASGRALAGAAALTDDAAA